MVISEMTATQFKTHCLRILDEVSRSGRAVVITKHGRPVARLEPAVRNRELVGSVRVNVSDKELVAASMGRWDVERE